MFLFWLFKTVAKLRQTAGARMQELRQIQRHHDPVRLMGKNLEAEYIPKPVTKFKTQGKGLLGNIWSNFLICVEMFDIMKSFVIGCLDNPVVAPISTFTKQKKGPQNLTGTKISH